jgi:hypothetical protein
MYSLHWKSTQYKYLITVCSRFYYCAQHLEMIHMKHNLVISLQKHYLQFFHILEVDSKTSMVYMSYIA